eukprot:5877430-Pyramimonas_sp.AAC.1
MLPKRATLVTSALESFLRLPPAWAAPSKRFTSLATPALHPRPPFGVSAPFNVSAAPPEREAGGRARHGHQSQKGRENIP